MHFTQPKLTNPERCILDMVSNKTQEPGHDGYFWQEDAAGNVACFKGTDSWHETSANISTNETEQRGANKTEQRGVAEGKGPKANKKQTTSTEAQEPAEIAVQQQLRILKDMLIQKIILKGDALIKYDPLQSMALQLSKDRKTIATSTSHTAICEALFNDLPAGWLATGKGKQRKITRVIQVVDGKDISKTQVAKDVQKRHRQEFDSLPGKIQQLNELRIKIVYHMALDPKVTALLAEVVMEDVLHIVPLTSTSSSSPKLGSFSSSSSPKSKDKIPKSSSQGSVGIVLHTRIKDFVQQVVKVYLNPDLAHLRQNIHDAFGVKNIPKDWHLESRAAKYMTTDNYPTKNGQDTVRNMLKDITFEFSSDNFEPQVTMGCKGTFTIESDEKAWCLLRFRNLPEADVKALSVELTKAHGCPVTVTKHRIEIKKQCGADDVWSIAQTCHKHFPTIFIDYKGNGKKPAHNEGQVQKWLTSVFHQEHRNKNNKKKGDGNGDGKSQSQPTNKSTTAKRPKGQDKPKQKKVWSDTKPKIPQPQVGPLANSGLPKSRNGTGVKMMAKGQTPKAKRKRKRKELQSAI